MGTGNYSATSNNMKLVHWPEVGHVNGLVTFGTARRGLGEAAARPSPLRCTKCNSPPVNGQCTNCCIAVLLYNGPLFCGSNVPIKGLNIAVYGSSAV